MNADGGRLTGRKVAVMGASGALAEALSLHLFQAGASLALTTTTSSGEEAFALSRLARRLSKDGRSVRAESLDMSNMTAVQVGLRKLVKDIGGLDVLVAMPELRFAGPAERMSEADWASVMGTNLGGAFFACKAAAREMAAGGMIVVVTGEANSENSGGKAAFAAAAAGARALTVALAKEWSTKGISVHGLDRPEESAEKANFLEKVLDLIAKGS